jgi:hypothetical protein
VADEPDFKERHVPSMFFPWDVPELLAADTPLIKMIGAGKFDPWMYREREPSGATAKIRDWVARVLSIRHTGNENR